MDYQVPTQQDAAEILWVRPICKQPGRYMGWPTVCRRQDNELVVVFSGDRAQHVCPWGKVQGIRSTDDGETWTEPVTISNTPLDDRDAGLIETADGTLVANWFTSTAFIDAATSPWLRSLESEDVLDQWSRHAEKLTPEIREQWLGPFTRRSTDGGATWETPVRHLGSAPHGGILLADGRLLFVGKMLSDGRTLLVVEESRDDGRSWQQIGTVPQNPGDDANQYFEPHVVETGDGRLVSMFRYHCHEDGKGGRTEAGCLLRQAESTDGGKTWSTCHATAMQGYPAHLTRLQDDTLVCVYGRRCSPFGEFACISRDGGRSWDVEREIKLAAATSGDLGYPASTELADGSILTVFYQIAQPGERTCMMATRWRLTS
jgi:sialidase-1